jgi:hypothetical protein
MPTANISKLLLPLVLTLACDGRSGGSALATTESEPRPALAEASADLPPILAPYPRGTWRIGDRGELGYVMLWSSQILIRFREAKNDEVNFNLQYWYSVPPPPTRSRDEALVLARQVAARAKQDPESFAALSRQYSEDITSAQLGGVVGGVSAQYLTLWPQVIDALGALRPGETSEVIETWYGFHVFRRSPPPPEGRVSGARLVIGHDQAGWLRYEAADAVPKRSRAEALALATQIYEQARQQPERFDELVARYSEHRSKTEGGDFGSWSTREPSGYPRELETLSKLAVGEIAAPIDSPIGFEILRRTPERPRETYATNGTWMAFDPTLPDDDPTSRASVLARATALADKAAGDPALFAAAQADTCCTYTVQWEEGKGTPALAAAIRPLELNQVARAPVQSEHYFVVAQRTAPKEFALPTVTFEVPVHARIDLEYQLAALNGDAGEVELRRLSERLPAELGLAPDVLQRLVALHDVPRRFDAALFDDRVDATVDFLAAVKQLLTPEQFARYLGLLERHFTDYVMDPAHEPIPSRWRR